MFSTAKHRKACEAAEAACQRVAEGDLDARIANPADFGSFGPLLEMTNRLLDMVQTLSAGEAVAENQRNALETAAVVCRRAAAGDLEARITNTEDFGTLGPLLDAINHVLDVADAYVRKSSASLEFASQRKYWRPFLLRGMPGDFRRGARVIDAAREAMERRHNLTEDFQAIVSHVVGVVSEAATQLETTAQSMSGDAEATHDQSVAASTASERTAVYAQAVAAGTEQLSASIGEIGQQAAETVKAAQGVATEMERANIAAAQLVESALKIDRVIKFIAEVAGQTNLLAFNATIKAARAGELGRGFAVVAGEVKALADQARNATSEIASQMKEIQEASQATGAAIKLIDERVQSMRQMATAIAAVVEQQSAATAEISRNVQQAAGGSGDVSRSVATIATASEKTGKAAEQVFESARQLSGEAKGLDGKVRDFLVKIRET